jgi:hypothetical protein
MLLCTEILLLAKHEGEVDELILMALLCALKLLVKLFTSLLEVVMVQKADEGEEKVIHARLLEFYYLH